jgi:hypothetical protein
MLSLALLSSFRRTVCSVTIFTSAELEVSITQTPVITPTLFCVAGGHGENLKPPPSLSPEIKMNYPSRLH